MHFVRQKLEYLPPEGIVVVEPISCKGWITSWDGSRVTAYMDGDGFNVTGVINFFMKYVGVSPYFIYTNNHGTFLFRFVPHHSGVNELQICTDGMRVRKMSNGAFVVSPLSKRGFGAAPGLTPHMPPLRAHLNVPPTTMPVFNRGLTTPLPVPVILPQIPPASAPVVVSAPAPVSPEISTPVAVFLGALGAGVLFGLYMLATE